LYSIIFLAFVSSTLAFSALPLSKIRRVFFWTGALCVLLLVFMLAANGFNGRTIGWAPPNNIGKIAFCAVVLAQASGHVRRWMIILPAIFFLGLVSSRGMLLSTGLFLIIFYVLVEKNTLKAMLTLFFAFAAGTTALFFDLLINRQSKLIDLFLNFSAINDIERGLSSGLTGRIYYWSNGLDLLSERPILGYGFRTRAGTDSIFESSASAHSGWINLGLDLGLPGIILVSFLFIVCIMYALSMRLKFRYDGAVSKVFSAVASFFIVTPLYWLLEPTYFNFGTIDIIVLFTFMSLLVRQSAFKTLTGATAHGTATHHHSGSLVKA